MIRILLGILFLLSVATASQNLSFGNLKRVYTVQLFCVPNSYTKEDAIQKVNYKLRSKLHLYRTKKLLVGCYSKATTYEAIKKELQKVRKLGYKQAYIRKTGKLHYQKKKRKKTLSKYVISQMIAKANKAYKKGDDMQAMMYYEMLLSAGAKSEKIKNNLCYLYGRNGAWLEAKAVIDRQKYQAKLVYAYANGAARTLQKNFYENLKEYIMLDGSGHLALLAGYYFEQKGKKEKALRFYKRAYTKNKNDVYNSYAYARYLDIIRKKQEARELYKRVYSRTKEGSDIYNAIKFRLYR